MTIWRLKGCKHCLGGDLYREAWAGEFCCLQCGATMYANGSKARQRRCAEARPHRPRVPAWTASGSHPGGSESHSAGDAPEENAEVSASWGVRMTPEEEEEEKRALAALAKMMRKLESTI